jgi:hypothetical protein
MIGKNMNRHSTGIPNLPRDLHIGLTLPAIEFSGSSRSLPKQRKLFSLYEGNWALSPLDSTNRMAVAVAAGEYAYTGSA